MLNEPLKIAQDFKNVAKVANFTQSDHTGGRVIDRQTDLECLWDRLKLVDRCKIMVGYLQKTTFCARECEPTYKRERQM